MMQPVFSSSHRALAGLRSAAAGTSARLAGPAFDLGLGLLDPGQATSIGTEVLRLRARRLYERGVIDEEEWVQAQSLLGQGRLDEAKQLMDATVGRYTRGSR